MAALRASSWPSVWQGQCWLRSRRCAIQSSSACAMSESSAEQDQGPSHTKGTTSCMDMHAASCLLSSSCKHHLGAPVHTNTADDEQQHPKTIWSTKLNQLHIGSITSLVSKPQHRQEDAKVKPAPCCCHTVRYASVTAALRICCVKLAGMAAGML